MMWLDSMSTAEGLISFSYRLFRSRRLELSITIFHVFLIVKIVPISDASIDRGVSDFEM